jgi:hypothetical protein
MVLLDKLSGRMRVLRPLGIARRPIIVLSIRASPPAAVMNHGSYDCRGRNNDAGAEISEHGRGNALDLGPIRLANGAVMGLSKRSTPQSFRQRLRSHAENHQCHPYDGKIVQPVAHALVPWRFAEDFLGHIRKHDGNTMRAPCDEF